MRLDEILLRRGLATRTQIQEALDYQKRNGGRIESHLFRFGYVDESGLVSALSEQFGCEGIQLSDIDIPDSVIAMMQPDITFGKLVLPFAHDPATNTLRVACENPREENLREELIAAVPGKNIQLFVALSDILKVALIANYRMSVEYAGKDDRHSEREDTWLNENTSHGRVLILDADGTDIRTCEHALREAGFDTWVARSTDTFMDQFASGRFDILLLMHSGSCEDLRRLVDNLSVQGFEPDVLPTCLLTNELPVGACTPLLKEGFADAVPMSDPELVVVKLKRLRAMLTWEAERRFVEMKSLGTHGTLEDMNLIDLLQALGPSFKTARISVTAEGKQLTVFLDKGKMIHAECDGIAGPDAIYEAIPWTRGIWSVDPIEPAELPEPNTFSSNESILLEGCRRMDDKNHSEENDVAFPNWL